MKLTLKSNKLSVEVNPIGMELSSIKSNSTNLEYLWQGDPTVWSGQAPVLFPIIGALKEGLMTYKNQEYKIPKHGLVRFSDKPKVKSCTENSVLLSFQWDEETLQHYPFKFELEIEFTVNEKTIEVIHRVINLGSETMFYSLGAHPAFNCPLHEGEKYEDYLIRFANSETDNTWEVESSGLIGLNQKSVLENTDVLPLHSHLFDDDALIFKNLNSREVTLCHKDKGSILSVTFEDFNYLGIWAKPEAPFVCIEPWLGIADSVDSNQIFEEKEGIISLEPQQTDVKKYSITILN